MFKSFSFRWQEIGMLSEIFCFPVKSCGPLKLSESNCSQIGLEFGPIGDRVFMVTRLDYEYVTARTYPKMVLIRPSIEGTLITLTAPEMEEITIDVAKLYDLKRFSIENWFQESVDVVDAGDEIAEWMSQYVIGQHKGLRVVFYPSKEPKAKCKPRDRPFKPAESTDQGALQDETSFMLVNQGSVDDLKFKLGFHINAQRFRPNFVVVGPEAWQEDNWSFIKIGDETIFEKVQPCTRCVFTNIDPESGERNAEVLKTLKATRTLKEAGPSPVFGIQLGVRRKGVVVKGDKIYIGK